MSLNFRLFNKQVVPKFKKKKIYIYIYIYNIYEQACKQYGSIKKQKKNKLNLGWFELGNKFDINFNNKLIRYLSNILIN